MEIRDGPYTVYALQFPNGKFYVGITSQDPPEKRWANGKGYGKGLPVRNAIEKYGWDNVEKQIVASHLTKDEADNFERLLIDRLNLTDNRYGYN